MEIKKENVIAVYNVARETGETNTMHALESLFGKETFKPKDITECVKTFEDACRELGADHPFVLAYHNANIPEVIDDNRDILTYMKLRIICAALNEGWQPEFTESEWRWYPWFTLWTEKELSGKDDAWKADNTLISIEDYSGDYAGFVSAYSNCAPSRTSAHIGSRLCLKSKDLATYCGKQFIRLWADFNLSKK